MSVDPNSPTWAAVKAFVETEIETARGSLEGPLAVEMTNFHRGRIKALRDLLALAEPTPTIQASPVLY